MIEKTIYSFVVYHEDDDQPEDLGHALAESFDGHMVGSVISEQTETVDPARLSEELLAIGNDGKFFDPIF